MQTYSIRSPKAAPHIRAEVSTPHTGHTAMPGEDYGDTDDQPPSGAEAAEMDMGDIEKVLAGNEMAYTRLIERYQQKVARALWRFTRDPLLHEDLVQEVFVQTYFSLKNFGGRSSFYTWLMTITNRAGYRFWKSKERGKKMQPLGDWDRPDEPAEDLQARAEQAGKLVHELLQRLNPEERMIISLLHLEQMPTDQIGEIMELSREAVKMRALRARQKLKTIIQSEGLEEELPWID